LFSPVPISLAPAGESCRDDPGLSYSRLDNSREKVATKENENITELAVQRFALGREDY
jgi:hypothetical protein